MKTKEVKASFCFKKIDDSMYVNANDIVKWLELMYKTHKEMGGEWDISTVNAKETLLFFQSVLIEAFAMKEIDELVSS